MVAADKQVEGFRLQILIETRGQRYCARSSFVLFFVDFLIYSTLNCQLSSHLRMVIVHDFVFFPYICWQNARLKQQLPMAWDYTSCPSLFASLPCKFVVSPLIVIFSLMLRIMFIKSRVPLSIVHILSCTCLWVRCQISCLPHAHITYSLFSCPVHVHLGHIKRTKCLSTDSVITQLWSRLSWRCLGSFYSIWNAQYFPLDGAVDVEIVWNSQESFLWVQLGFCVNAPSNQPTSLCNLWRWLPHMTISRRFKGKQKYSFSLWKEQCTFKAFYNLFFA